MSGTLAGLALRNSAEQNHRWSSNVGVGAVWRKRREGLQRQDKEIILGICVTLSVNVNHVEVEYPNWNILPGNMLGKGQQRVWFDAPYEQTAESKENIPSERP